MRLLCVGHSIDVIWKNNHRVRHTVRILDLNSPIPRERSSPVTAPSKAWVCDLSLAVIVVRIPPEAWVPLSLDCCFCVGLIIHPEEFYQLWWV